MKSRADDWDNEAGVGGRTLVYQKHGAGPTAYPLLSVPGIKPWSDWTVPMSMREVEPGVRLVMEDDRSTNDPHVRMGCSCANASKVMLSLSALLAS